MNTTETSRATEAGWGDLLRGRNAVRSLALAGGVALHAVNVYLTITILPSIVGDIGGVSFYAWNTTLFILASILGSAITAQWLSRSGPRGTYRWAAVIFIVGSGVCALAPNMAVLLVGRTIQGFGGGLLFALSYAMIQVVFDRVLWARAMALVSSMWGIATLLGPAIGGLFAAPGLWRWAFGLLVVIGPAYILLTQFVIPRHHADESDNNPLPVAFRQLIWLTAAVLAISIGSVSNAIWANALGLVIAVGCTFALGVTERRATIRLLPHDAVTLRWALGATYLTMGLLVISMQSETFVPYFLQSLHGISPLLAGYIAALMAAGWAVAAIVVSGVGDRAARRCMVIGPLLVLVGLIALVLFMADTVTTPVNVALSCAGLVLVGFGIGVAWPHLLTQVLVVAPSREADLASAGITTIQLFATASGAALAGMIANVAGFSDPGGEIGVGHAAQALFGIFAVLSVATIAASARAARYNG